MVERRLIVVSVLPMLCLGVWLAIFAALRITRAPLLPFLLWLIVGGAILIASEGLSRRLHLRRILAPRLSTKVVLVQGLFWIAAGLLFGRAGGPSAMLITWVIIAARLWPYRNQTV